MCKLKEILKIPKVLISIVWSLCEVSTWLGWPQFSSVQLLSLVRLLWPCGLQHTSPPRPYQMPKSTQTHLHWVSDAIRPSHPLPCPSPPAFNLSQQQGLFKWVSSSHQVAKVLAFQLQHQSFQWIFRTDFL